MLVKICECVLTQLLKHPFIKADLIANKELFAEHSEANVKGEQLKESLNELMNATSPLHKRSWHLVNGGDFRVYIKLVQHTVCAIQRFSTKFRLRFYQLRLATTLHASHRSSER